VPKWSKTDLVSYINKRAQDWRTPAKPPNKQTHGESLKSSTGPSADSPAPEDPSPKVPSSSPSASAKSGPTHYTLSVVPSPGKRVSPVGLMASAMSFLPPMPAQKTPIKGTPVKATSTVVLHI